MKPQKATKKLPSYLNVGVFRLGRVHAGMDRIALLPRNRFFNAYIHFFNGPDIDDYMHDHPWWSLSVLLRGELVEITPKHPKGRKAPRICLRPPTAAHSIIKGSWGTRRSGAGGNEGTPTPASPDTASATPDTNANLGDDSQSTGGGHIASGTGGNEGTPTPADAAAFEQTSPLSDPETLGSTTTEEYTPLDTGLGDDTQSSKDKSNASEEDNKDDAPATGGHGQGNRKPTGWK